MKEKQSRTQNFTLTIFLISWLLLCLYSYSQKDLNLTIFNYPGFRDLQAWMVWLGYYQRSWSTLAYGAILAGLFWGYLRILKSPVVLSLKLLVIMGLVLIGTGLLAYPLFSHDIFNYLFNAKMVLVYHANPHVQTAIQFINDPWVRFMRNIHTPAPYAYGWTFLSLLPVWLGLPSFTLSLLFMKVLGIGFWVLESALLYKISLELFPNEARKRLTLFLFNPLILTETLIVGHNDSVMMALALLAIWLVIRYDERQRPLSLGLALIAWAASVAIKYATVMLFPLFWFRKKVDIFTVGGLGLLMVLLTRPDQVHSWYLHWGITLLLLSKYPWAVKLSLVLSFAGLLRYLPYIYYGHWDEPVSIWRWILLLLPLGLFLMKPLVRKMTNY